MLWKQQVYPLDIGRDECEQIKKYNLEKDKEQEKYTGSVLPARTLHFSVGASGRYIYLVGEKSDGCNHGVIHVFDLWAGTNK
uniref:WD_REPEATS_REGION domain-containing protein n=1 Tax=Heterorhabditis bacteriophora TaxID=37862 RepID=A0A1I7WC12_HETBA